MEFPFSAKIGKFEKKTAKKTYIYLTLNPDIAELKNPEIISKMKNKSMDFKMTIPDFLSPLLQKKPEQLRRKDTR